MWSDVSDAIKVAKDYGLGFNGLIWLIVFSLIATLAGKTAKAAISFVGGLLNTSSELREQIKGQLDEAVSALSRLQKDVIQEQDLNRRLKNELSDSQRQLRELIDKLSIAESRVSTLTITIEMRDRQLEELRHQIGVAKQLGSDWFVGGDSK